MMKLTYFRQTFVYQRHPSLVHRCHEIQHTAVNFADVRDFHVAQVQRPAYVDRTEETVIGEDEVVLVDCDEIGESFAYQCNVIFSFFCRHFRDDLI